MPLAPWRSPLAHALHRNRALAYARYLQLATVRGNGLPANRTLVFRGFLDDTNHLKFVTDARSEKADQIHYSSYGEASWYFPKTREQFRLLGQLTLVKHQHTDPTLQTARQQIWHDLSDAARTQFTWASPGKPKTENELNPTNPDLTLPAPNFCLLLLDPTQVDHLELRGNPQNRWLYQVDLETGWSVQEINP